MRVCPKCGYVDPPEWRHMRWSYWIDFATIEDFKRLNPKLCERLLKGEKIVEDKHYVYRISKKVVHRKAKIDYGTQFRIPMDHTQHDQRKYWNRDPFQRKLVDSEQ